jgi:hypothetical protein
MILLLLLPLSSQVAMSAAALRGCAGAGGTQTGLQQQQRQQQHKFCEQLHDDIVVWSAAI